MALYRAPRDQRAGLYWQDVFTARTLLRVALEPGLKISGVWSECDVAQHVDDLAVRFDGFIEHHQLKHSVDRNGRLTSADLFAQESGDRSLLGKLYGGWLVARDQHAPVPTRVSLWTTQLASRDPRNEILAPAVFLERILQPAKEDRDWRPPADLEDAVNRIAAAAAIPDASSFAEFLSALDIHVGSPSAEDLRAEMVDLALRRLKRHPPGVDNEIAALIDHAARWSSSGARSWRTLTEIQEVIDRVFDPPLVEAVRPLTLPPDHVVRHGEASAIRALVERTAKGLIFVAGPPGSGKTTMATWLANSWPDVAVRYHVVHPEKFSPIQRQERARAFIFVSGMLEGLREALPDRFAMARPTPETLEAACEEMWSRLQELGRERKVIVVVDGIDHLVRERVATAGSVFGVLDRDSATFPDNVVFLLFGQPDWPYPETILERAQRHDLDGFTKPEIQEILAPIASLEIAARGAPLVDRILDRTSGNPLSILYTRELLSSAASVEEAENLLDTPAAPTKDPVDSYIRLRFDVSEHLRGVADSHSMTEEILGFFAVATLPIDHCTLARAFDHALSEWKARDVLRTLRPVLKEVAAGRFALFHDDFRRYVHEAVGEVIPTAHARWAGYLARHHEERLGQRAEHLWLAGQHHDVVALIHGCDPLELIRKRPAAEVSRAALLALSGACEIGDPVQVARIGLAGARLSRMLGDEYDVGDELTLESISRTVPPAQSEIGFQAMHRREQALGCLAVAAETDPEPTGELLRRWMIPMPALAAADQLASLNYAAALVPVLLVLRRDHDLRELLSIEQLANATYGSFESFVSERSADEVANLLTRFEGDEVVCRIVAIDAARRLDTGDADLVSLVVGNADVQQVAPGLALALRIRMGERVAIPEEIRRRRLPYPEHRTEDWRPFITAALLEGACAPSADLDAIPPPELDRFTKPPGGDIWEDHRPLRLRVWRTAVAAGLMHRNPELVSSLELGRLVQTLFRPGDLPATANIQLRDLTPTLVRLLLEGAGASPEHLEALIKGLMSPVRAMIGFGDLRGLAIYDACRDVAPEFREWILTEVLNRLVPDDPEPHGAREWFSEWRDRLVSANRAVPDEFDAAGLRAGLGLVEKDYDVANRVSVVLERLMTREPAEAVERRLEEALVALDTIQRRGTGRGGIWRTIPEVLGIALAVSPSVASRLFEFATRPGTSEYAFGPLVARVIEKWLRIARGFSDDELAPMWQWLAAANGALVSGHASADLLGSVSERISDDELRRDLLIRSQRIACDPAEEEERSASDNATEPLEDPELAEFELSWLTTWQSGYHRAFVEYLNRNGDEAWKKAGDLIAKRLAVGRRLLTFDAEIVADFFIKYSPAAAGRDGELFEMAIDYLRDLKGDEPTDELPPARPTIANLTDFVSDRLVRGLEDPEAETVLRCCRGLTALLRVDGESVHRSMAPLFDSDDDQVVATALSVCFGLAPALGTFEAAVRRLTHHRNAWVRALACELLGEEVEWRQERRALHAPEPLLSQREDADSVVSGRRYVSSPDRVREIRAREFSELADVNIDQVRSRLHDYEVEQGPELKRKRTAARRVAIISSTRDSNAAGRYALELAQNDRRRGRLLAAASAPGDPILLSAFREFAPPVGWIDLGSYAEVHSDEYRVDINSALIIPPQGQDVTRWLEQISPDTALQALFPLPICYPSMAAWRDLATMPPPSIPDVPGRTLVFRPCRLVPIGRATFEIAPRWHVREFAGLRYERSPFPRFVDEQGRDQVRAFSIEKNDSRRYSFSDSPVMSFQIGWCADPNWLRSRVSDLNRLAIARRWEVHSHREGGRPSVAPSGSEWLRIQAVN